MRENIVISAVVLLVLLVGGVRLRASDEVRDAISRWGSGRRVEVVLKSGETITGRLGAVQQERFTLRVEGAGGSERELRFDEVRSVKLRMTRGRKWTIAGGVYAALVLLGIILGK